MGAFFSDSMTATPMYSSWVPVVGALREQAAGKECRGLPVGIRQRRQKAQRHAQSDQHREHGAAVAGHAACLLRGQPTQAVDEGHRDVGHDRHLQQTDIGLANRAQHGCRLAEEQARDHADRKPDHHHHAGTGKTQGQISRHWLRPSPFIAVLPTPGKADVR